MSQGRFWRWMAGGRLHFERGSATKVCTNFSHGLPVSLAVLNPDLVANPESYQQRFRLAAPFPHLVIDNFFVDDFARSLTETFPAFEAGNAMVGKVVKLFAEIEIVTPK